VRPVFGGDSQFYRNAWCVCVCVCMCVCVCVCACRDTGYEARGSTQQMRDWQIAALLQTYIGRRAAEQCSTFKYVSPCIIL
jgi:hypothetical protein